MGCVPVAAVKQRLRQGQASATGDSWQIEVAGASGTDRPPQYERLLADRVPSRPPSSPRCADGVRSQLQGSEVLVQLLEHLQHKEAIALVATMEERSQLIARISGSPPEVQDEPSETFAGHRRVVETTQCKLQAGQRVLDIRHHRARLQIHPGQR